MGKPILKKDDPTLDMIIQNLRSKMKLMSRRIELRREAIGNVSSPDAVLAALAVMLRYVRIKSL